MTYLFEKRFVRLSFRLQISKIKGVPRYAGLYQSSKQAYSLKFALINYALRHILVSLALAYWAILKGNVRRSTGLRPRKKNSQKDILRTKDKNKAKGKEGLLSYYTWTCRYLPYGERGILRRLLLGRLYDIGWVLTGRKTNIFFMSQTEAPMKSG